MNGSKKMEEDDQGEQSTSLDADNGDPDMVDLANRVKVKQHLLSNVRRTGDSQQVLHAQGGNDAKKSPPTPHETLREAHACQCGKDTYKKRLPNNPSEWPQSPVMLRPASGTIVRGIRFADSSNYQHFKGFCTGCILPLNTGAEKKGKSIVIDFESEHFVGTLLMRILEAPSNIINVSNDSHQINYFDGKKRRFQAVVKGKFKTELKVTECVSGQIFDRPAGKLPSRLILSSFLKVVSSLAPQLEVTIDGEEPRCLTPLVAVVQTIIAKRKGNSLLEKSSGNPNRQQDDDQEVARSVDMELPVEEPHATDPTSMMQQAKIHHRTNISTRKTSIVSRQRARKKVYNRLFANKATEPTFQLDTEYTFEFYQHLLLFGKSLAIDMGKVIGAVPLAPITDGQPIKFMSAHKERNGKLKSLWSFEIWHKTLYDLANETENET